MHAIGTQWRTLGVAALAAAWVFAAAAQAVADDSAARRVVAVGGSVTEIVHALGAADQLVAVDSTSTYPAAADELPDVGYMRQLSAEPMLALAPSLVLAEADAGPPTALDQLRSAGVTVTLVPDEPTPRGVTAKIRTVAEALGVDDRGSPLAAEVDKAFAALADDVAALEARPSVLFLLAVGNGAPLAAGEGTSAAGIIALAGGTNAARGFEGYKPLSTETLVDWAPQYVLVTRRTLDMLGGPEGLRALPGLEATPAARKPGRIVAMDGLKLLGFGPRTPDAARTLMRSLHPDRTAER